MATLLAQGPKVEQTWRRPLPVDVPVIVGREAGEWSIAWDPWLSRHHVELTWHAGGFLHVKRLPTAQNPLFLNGFEAERFELPVGGHFVAGMTTFVLEDEQTATSKSDPSPVEERTVSVPELDRLPFRDASHQIDVLGKLPEVISSAGSDIELWERLAGLLLAGMRRASVVALVDASDAQQVQVLHHQFRSAGRDFQPSRRLATEAIRNRKQAVLHLWGAAGDHSQFTAGGNFDWAFCTPVRGEASQGWGIYAAGKLTGDLSATFLGPLESHALRDDLKFAELAASILSSLQQVRLLQRRQARLRTFFSPAVQNALADAKPDEVLEAREADVSVLFCDLRGFARQSEQEAGDLLALLKRVSRALGVMTQNILDQGGVIGDFQGDAALGFGAGRCRSRT